jgi:hypothetical protein
LFLLASFSAVTQGIFTATGSARLSCSLVGQWNSTDYDPLEQITFFADGRLSGYHTSGYYGFKTCGYEGRWSVSIEYAYFEYSARLVNCSFVSEDDAQASFREVFCDFPAPAYTVDSAVPFTAGCFVAFNPDSNCDVMQFSTFNGLYSSSNGNNWILNQGRRQTGKAILNKGPPECSVSGRSYSTLAENMNFFPKVRVVSADSPGAFQIGNFYKNRITGTIFNATFFSNGKYLSTIHHYNSSTGLLDCSVVYEGSYHIGAPQNTFPEDTLHPYTSSSSVISPAPPGSYCNSTFLEDPLSCEFLTTTSSFSRQYEASQCFIVWDNDPRVPACNYFRLWTPGTGDSSISAPLVGIRGPIYHLLPRKGDKDQNSEDLMTSTATQLTTSILALLSLLLLI